MMKMIVNSKFINVRDSGWNEDIIYFEFDTVIIAIKKEDAEKLRTHLGDLLDSLEMKQYQEEFERLLQRIDEHVSKIKEIDEYLKKY